MWLQEEQKDLQRIKNFKDVSYQLELFEDEDGVWRFGGRLAKTNLPYSVFVFVFSMFNIKHIYNGRNIKN